MPAFALKTRPSDRSVSFALPRAQYGEDGLRIAAAVFDARAEVEAAQGAKSWEVTLRSKRRVVSAPDLELLAGEFLNELLNQEYRFIVGRFHRKSAGLIVTKVLLSARGGEAPAGPPPGEESPEFKAEAARLMKEAEEEIRRVMPRKLPPQGTPIPPETGA